MPKNTHTTPQSSRCRRHRGPIKRLFRRPPLAHLFEPDDISGYWEAYDVFTPILRDFPFHMLDALEDASKAERLRREVIA